MDVMRKNPHAVALGRLGGASNSLKKRIAAKANGGLGGRPRKTDRAKKETVL